MCIHEALVHQIKIDQYFPKANLQKGSSQITKIEQILLKDVTFVFSKGDSVIVNIMKYENSKTGESNFNWSEGIRWIVTVFNNISLLETTNVTLAKYPSSVLKTKDENGKKIYLKKYLNVIFKYI